LFSHPHVRASSLTLSFLWVPPVQDLRLLDMYTEDMMDQTIVYLFRAFAMIAEFPIGSKSCGSMLAAS
jgi:hypothetical protein